MNRSTKMFSTVARQQILALTFYEVEQLYLTECKNIEAFNNSNIDFPVDEPKHSYYTYFNCFKKPKAFDSIQDEVYRDLILNTTRYQWYDVAKQVGFNNIVQVKTLNRYRMINPKIPCAMNEDEAREYIQTFFDYREKQELARELAQDNWQYDYTEITEIYFNMGMINFIKRIIPEIDNAIKLALR